MSRNIWLILTFSFFGPLVGAVTFVLVAVTVDPILSRPGESGLASMAEHWPLIVTTGYVLGITPAFISAILQILATPSLPTVRRRLIAAPIIGALVSTIVLGLFFLTQGFNIRTDGWIFALFALTGGVAAFVSILLVELFHKLPAKAAG